MSWWNRDKIHVHSWTPADGSLHGNLLCTSCYRFTGDNGAEEQIRQLTAEVERLRAALAERAEPDAITRRFEEAADRILAALDEMDDRSSGPPCAVCSHSRGHHNHLGRCDILEGRMRCICQGWKSCD